MPATLLTLEGPYSGLLNTASDEFTVTPDAAWSGTVTPAVKNGQGTFSPASLTWAADASAKTFTYTPSSKSTALKPHSISITNDGGLTNLAALSYTVTALAPLTLLKTYLGIDDSDLSEDRKLTMLLLQLDAIVPKWVGRDLIQQDYTEYHDGVNHEMLVLRNRPVTAVAHVWVDPAGYYGQNPAQAFPDATEWEQGVYWALPKNEMSERNGGFIRAIVSGWPGPVGLGGSLVERLGGWPSGRGNIKVQYTAGYNPIPDDLQLATCQLAAELRKAAEDGRGALKGDESLGKYAYRILSSKEDSGGLEVAMCRTTFASYREAHF